MAIAEGAVAGRRKGAKRHAAKPDAAPAAATPAGEDGDLVKAPAPAPKKKKLSRKKEAAGGAREAEEADGGLKEEENPGMLLTDLVSSAPAAAEQQLSRVASSSRRRRKAAQSAAPPTEADADDAGDELDALGLVAGLDGGDGDDEADDAQAGLRLAGAIGRLDEVAGGSTSSSAVPGRAEAARPESEFHAGAFDEEVTFDDLLAPLGDAPNLGEVRRQLQKLARHDAPMAPVSEVKKTREERAAQYDASSKDVRKWVPQVQQMKLADQVVLGEVARDAADTSVLTRKFEAADDFEKELEAITRAAGTTEDDLKGAKMLPVNSTTRDETQRRHISKLKALMLREQQASKRIKKIKSKAYHRIQRKAESREREVLLERLEHENPELAKALRTEYEKKHATMRLQRQRNARKKWASTMQRFAKGDRKAQQEITKQSQAAHDEEQSLKRAVRGQRPDQSEDSEAVDLSGTDSEDDGTRGVAKDTITKAKKLTMGSIKELQQGGELPTKGILGMNFMRNAIKRKQEEAKLEAEGVLQELEKMDDRLEAALEPGDEEDEAAATKAGEKEGAEAEEPKAKRFTEEELAKAREEVDAMFDNEEGGFGGQHSSVSGPLTIKGVAKASASSSSAAPAAAKSSAAATASSSSGSRGAAQKAQVDEASAGPSADNPWLSMGAEEEAPEAEKADSAAATEAAGASVFEGKAADREKASKKRKRNKKSGPEDEAVGGAEDAEDLLRELDVEGESAKEQRELVRTAFIEGTQAEDFDKDLEDIERKKDEEAEQDSMKLAGWGHWTGDGIKPRRKPEPKKKAQEKRKGPSIKMYEGENAVSGKYFVDKVPYPFQSPEQYDRQMRMPSGPEWNTSETFKDRIKPKVVVRAGAVVTPLQYVKNLPPQQREDAIKSWGAPKAPKRLKARF